MERNRGTDDGMGPVGQRLPIAESLGILRAHFGSTATKTKLRLSRGTLAGNSPSQLGSTHKKRRSQRYSFTTWILLTTRTGFILPSVQTEIPICQSLAESCFLRCMTGQTGGILH